MTPENVEETFARGRAVFEDIYQVRERESPGISVVERGGERMEMKNAHVEKTVEFHSCVRQEECPVIGHYSHLCRVGDTGGSVFSLRWRTGNKRIAGKERWYPVFQTSDETSGMAES